MALNINAGVMRHFIEFYKSSDETDSRGRPLPLELAFPAIMGNVRYKSGGQLRGLGQQVTDETITILTWYDNRVNNSMFVKFNNTMYEVTHIKPDEILRSMVITAEVQRDS